MENQPEPKAGSSYSGWRDAFEGHACRYPHPFEATVDKQSECPQNRLHPKGCVDKIVRSTY